MVHPFASKLVFAFNPKVVGACPSVWSKAPLICPAVSKLLNILSIEIEDKFVPSSPAGDNLNLLSTWKMTSK